MFSRQRAEPRDRAFARIQVQLQAALRTTVDAPAVRTWTHSSRMIAQPAAPEEEPRQRAERVPYLLERIEQWLHVAGFHDARAEALLRDVDDAFRVLIADDEASFKSGTRYEVLKRPEMEVIELVPCEAVAPTPLEPALEPLVSALMPGTWMEFLHEGEPHRRCKLSVVFEQSRNHLFVDHRGLRVCELTAREVAEAIRGGRLRELKADPVVERALDKMITDLRSSIREGAAL